MSTTLRVALAASLLCAAARTASPQVAAPTPPLGWNSWDSYGLSITEPEWQQNVAWFHTHLQPAGWQYVVLDEGWYLAHPENAGGKADQGYTLDANGQYVAAPDRFPNGIAALAGSAHALGLRFGLHIIRGVPKAAVAANDPIRHSTFHAADAADQTDICRWNPDNFGVRDNAAGQAYYDSLMALYAGWGVDLLKVDCISQPYNAHEIHMIRRAIDKTRRPMVLSLSPGPTPLADAADAVRNASLWRISNDVWDVWSDPKLTSADFPETIRNQFDVLASWMPYQQPGHWPDADMLPVGTLGPRPGWGEPRPSRLTADETRSLLTLWSIARSPLILGANLTQLPPELEHLLTNPEFLTVNQTGSAPRRLRSEGDLVVWSSSVPGQPDARYLALFNLADTPAAPHLSWQQVGLSGAAHSVRDIWARHDLGSLPELAPSLPPHGSLLLRVQ